MRFLPTTGRRAIGGPHCIAGCARYVCGVSAHVPGRPGIRLAAWRPPLAWPCYGLGWSRPNIEAYHGTEMETTLRNLGELVKAAREDRGFTSQEDFAAAITPPTNRSVIAHLEQARRLPPAKALKAICDYLSIPKSVWEPFLEPNVKRRLDFEDALSELVGRTVTLRQHDSHSVHVAERAVLGLFGSGKTKEQLYDSFCGVLVYYGAVRPTREFVFRYFNPEAYRTIETFREGVKAYQVDAIRLFASFAEAYSELSQATRLDEVLAPLAPRADDRYRARVDWDVIEAISEERLPDLGYISATRIRKEQAERTSLCGFLDEIALRIELEGRMVVQSYPEKRRRKIGSLLRKFGSLLQHDLMSPLFAADPDEIRREAKRLAPRGAGDLEVMEGTQAVGQRNLSCYLAADHLDVYVATSMRTDADFVSVNAFVRGLFGHDSIRPLKLRYFNPTQSWIEDRVAKGLVEALMLKRADFTVYMAQKSDTFGKDSEASVALGQGKPVIVYVPRLYVPDVNIDSEALGLADRSTLRLLVETEAIGDDADVDETTDKQALLSQVLQLRLAAADDVVLKETVRTHWADFDLYGEASRIDDRDVRAAYRAWLDSVIKSGDGSKALPEEVKRQLVGILVAIATNYESRATVFREVHPLALQVILSTGVLNGILVARSVDACANLLARLIRNDLQLELHVDDDNYRLVERSTRSTIRVISRHQLIMNAFSAFYRRG